MCSNEFVTDSNGKLVWQRVQGRRQFSREFMNSIVGFRVRGQTRAKIIDVDFGFGVYGKTNLDPKRVQFEGQERMPSKWTRIVDRSGYRLFRIEEPIEILSSIAIAGEKHPLRVDSTFVAQRRMFVRAMHVDVDS